MRTNHKMSLSKKILIAISLFAISFNILAPHVYAQESTWYSPTFDDFNRKVNNPNQEEIFGERYTQAQVYWIVYSLVNFFTSGTFSKCVSEAATPTPEQIVACADESGASGGTSMGPILDLAGLADNINGSRPASGVRYISEKLDIVPVAHAQQNGFGFNTLSGAQNLWGAARNITYALMVLVIIVLAFGIMLRVKLNPQTVITIQSAIPRVVIALIAITFSFAIAGLLIDLSYVVQALVASFIYASGIVDANVIGGSGSFTLTEFLSTMNNSTHGILSIGMLTVLVALAPVLAIGTAVGFALPVVGTFTGFVGGVLFLLLVLVVFIIALLKLIWLFLRTYAVLLINIVFGPFIILMGAVNVGSGFMGWIKSLVAQISVFVVSSILIMVAHIFIWGSNFLGTACTTPPCANLFAQNRVLNPYNISSGTASLGGASLPGFAGFDPGTLGFLVSLVIILSIPSIASFIRDTISKPSRLELGLGGAGGIISTGMGMAADRFLSSGTRASDLAAAEWAAKQPGATAADFEEVRRLQESHDRVRSLARGKFFGGGGKR